MKRFSSSLRLVQKLNTHYERSATLRLARATRALKQVENKIANLNHAYTSSYLQNDWDKFETIYWGHQYRARLSHQLFLLQKELLVAKEQFNLRREEYHQAYRQNHAIRIINDKREIAYRKKEAQVIEDAVDDISRQLLYEK